MVENKWVSLVSFPCYYSHTMPPIYLLRNSMFETLPCFRGSHGPWWSLEKSPMNITRPRRPKHRFPRCLPRSPRNRPGRHPDTWRNRCRWCRDHHLDRHRRDKVRLSRRFLDAQVILWGEREKWVFVLGGNWKWWYMDVSKNRGTPKWMIYNGKPYSNG